MKNKTPLKTKDRVLYAACVIFATKGFKKATVAEICEAADANIASINYHFGDKEMLYDAVWKHAFSVTNKAFPLDLELSEVQTIEEHLYTFTRALLHRIFSEEENGLFAKLLYREMASPTLTLKKISTDFLAPQAQHLKNMIQRMPDISLSPTSLALCKNSIIAQCAFYNFSRPIRKDLLGKNVLSSSEVDMIAKHITQFSLGGLAAIQESQTNA